MIERKDCKIGLIGKLNLGIKFALPQDALAKKCFQKKPSHNTGWDLFLDRRQL